MCVNPKYNIGYRLRKMEGRYQLNKYDLCIKIDISERTLDKWIDTSKDEKFSIPSDALINIASHFNCTLTDLING